MPRRPSLYQTQDGSYRATIDGRKFRFGRDYYTAAGAFASALSNSSWSSRTPADLDLLVVAADRWATLHPSPPGPALVKTLLQFVKATQNTTVALGSLSASFAAAFVEFLQGRNNTAGTVSILAWATSQGVQVAQPERPKGLAKPGRAYRDVPLQLLAHALQGGQDGDRAEAGKRILRFIFLTGCRPKEARDLRWWHVDLVAAVCTFPASEHKTGGITARARTIYLTPPALAILSSRPAGRPDDLVFTNTHGRPFTRSNLYKIAYALGFHPCQLRHTFAQQALDQQPIEVVSELLGHTDLATTQIYAQIRSPRAKSAAKSLVLPSVSRS